VECNTFSFFTLGLLCIGFLVPISYTIVLFVVFFRSVRIYSGIPHLLSVVRKLLLSNNLDRAIKLCRNHPDSKIATALQEYIKDMRNTPDFRPTKDRIEEDLRGSRLSNRLMNNLVVLFDVLCVLSFILFVFYSPYNEVWIMPLVLSVPFLLGIVTALLLHSFFYHVHTVLELIPKSIEDLEKSILFIVSKELQQKFGDMGPSEQTRKEGVT